jgi:molecular chaperone HscA
MKRRPGDPTGGRQIVAALGIDFGTSSTRVVVSPGAPASKEIVLPSEVAILPDRIAVGDEVREVCDDEAAVIVSGLKRLLGRLPGDPVAEDLAKRQGVKLGISSAHLALTTAAGTRATVVEAVAAVLLEAATRAAGAGDHKAVIAIPEWFESRQEASLGVAARTAGIEVLRFIEDAAAMGLALASGDNHERTVGVIQLGAGSLGVSFTTIDEKSVFLLASMSDRRVGGDDITEALMEVALSDAAVGPTRRAACRRAVEQMKLELAHADEATRTLTLPGGEALRLQIRASELDDALNAMREPLADLYDEALEEAALEPDEVEVVYAVGGMSAYPAVADMILELTRQVPHCEPSLSGLVARGAAVQASILAAGAKGPLVFDGKSTGSLNLADFDGD